MTPIDPSQPIDIEKELLDAGIVTKYLIGILEPLMRSIAARVEESTIQRCKLAVSEEEDLNQMPRLYGSKAGEGNK